jgi:hypothetical protein
LNRKLRFALFALVAFGAAAALIVAGLRWKAESQQRSVEMVADWDQVRDIAAHANVSLPQLLGDLKKSGIAGMAISEDTVSGLRDDGFLVVKADPLPSGGARTLVSSFDQKLLDRVREHVERKLNLKAPLQTERVGENPSFVWPGNFEQIRPINVGLPPEEVAQVRAAGFDVVARIVNYPAADPANIAWSLKKLSDAGIRKVIFGGEEVLGYRAQVKETARLLGYEHLTYGSVEFSKQRGDEQLTQALKGGYIRVHSITPSEMTKLKKEEMVERYVRAAEERNIRMAYVRLLPYVTENGWADQTEFLDSIRHGIEKAGLHLGLAETYPPMNVPSPLRWTIGVGAAAAATLLLALIFPLGEGSLLLFFMGLAIVHLGLLMGTQEIGRKLIALESALLFPTLSLTALYGFLRYRLQEDRPFSPWGAYLATSAFSALGALYVVGLLSSRLYMMKAQQFMGIKAAHALPLVFLAVVLGLDFVTDHRTRHDMISGARQRLRQFFDQPMLVWQTAVGLVALAAIALLLLRTGNDPGIGVSPLEMRFRAVLDRVLYVRPRTKEFLVGHPALLLLLLWSSVQARAKAAAPPRWFLSRSALVLFILVGGIGQVSLVNTFCHIHTPLRISLIRILNGLWVGALLGAILYRFLPKRRTSTTP